MKNALKLLIGAAIISALALGCKKSDEKKNFLSVDGTKYSLSGAFLIDFSDYWDVSAHEMSLTLYSDGITAQEENTGVMRPVGSGQKLYFWLYTSAPSVLDARTYTFSSSKEQGTIQGYYSLNYSHALNTPIDESNVGIKSGTITVSKSGNEYEINIDCVDGHGKSVTGYFKGALPIY